MSVLNLLTSLHPCCYILRPWSQVLFSYELSSFQSHYKNCENSRAMLSEGNIWTVMIIWRIKGNIITTVLCPHISAVLAGVCWYRSKFFHCVFTLSLKVVGVPQNKCASFPDLVQIPRLCLFVRQFCFRVTVGTSTGKMQCHCSGRESNRTFDIRRSYRASQLQALPANYTGYLAVC